MSKDRMFFNPYTLAFIKAIVYFLCFLVTINFTEVDVDKAYYLSVIIYCLGCVGDYIEVAFYKTEKCLRTRIVSFFVAFIIIVIGLLSLGMFFDFDNKIKILSVLSQNNVYVYINWAMCYFWVSPAICGILLSITHIRETSNKNSTDLKVKSLGYSIKP